MIARFVRKSSRSSGLVKRCTLTTFGRGDNAPLSQLCPRWGSSSPLGTIPGKLHWRLPNSHVSVRNVSSSSRSCSASGADEEFEFKAETRKLLDIVTNSIYTNKEVFLRELVSNASDALEKLRYLQSTGQVAGGGAAGPLEVNITVDKTNKKLILSDNGVGMSKADLVNNLGTIARSGSKAFVQEMQGKGGEDAVGAEKGEGIIGQFGVGFYSAFMVSDSVSVTSGRALLAPGSGKVSEADIDSDSDSGRYTWTSDGTGKYTIRAADGSDAADGSGSGTGTTIEMSIKDDCVEFLEEDRIKTIVQQVRKRKENGLFVFV